MPHRQVMGLTRARARAMRAEATDAEKSLWRLLRDQRLAGLKWRRQVPIGTYIVDFVCFEHRLIVECDGSQHIDGTHDATRDNWLKSQGFAIERFWNHQVLNERESVVDTIVARCGLPW